MAGVRLEFYSTGKKEKEPKWLVDLSSFLKKIKKLPVENEGDPDGIVIFMEVKKQENYIENLKKKISPYANANIPIGFVLLYGQEGIPSLEYMFKLKFNSKTNILGSLSIEHLNRGDFEELMRAENLVKRFIRLVGRKSGREELKPIEWRIKVSDTSVDDMFLLSTYENFSELWFDIVEFMGKAEEEKGREREERQVLSLLLVGPTGVGKSQLARFIAKTIFGKEPLTVNMRAIAERQLEVELFGAAPGAYSSQKHARNGKIMLAAGVKFKEQNNKVTIGDTNEGLQLLLLDEVGDIPPSVQVKLLSYMDTGEVYPLGYDKPEKAPAVIVGTTNRDISKVLRDDFLNRFDFVVRLPDLSEGRNIRLLISYFLQHREVNPGSSVKYITVDAIEYLANRRYSGGFRELKRLLKKAVRYAELAGDNVLRLEYVIKGEGQNV